MREVIATGKTVEEATEAGCLELGLGRDEVSVEILEMPVKKLFKSTPARVKVTADDGRQPAAAPEAPKAAPTPAPVDEKPAPAQQAQAPARQAEAAGGDDTLLPNEPEVAIDLAQNPRAKKAADYLSAILAAVGVQNLKVTVSSQGDATLMRVEGDGITDKMEIRGETIQALSYLIDRAVNAGVDKKEEGYLRIRLDIAGYRNRREGELIALAGRTAKEVAKTGRSRTLAPMNPYERLIVHTAIGKMEGVTSESIGSDVERRVVIKSTAPNATDGEDWRPPRKGPGGGSRPPRQGDRGRGGPGGGSRDRDRGGNRGGGGRGGPGGGRDRDRGGSRGGGGGYHERGSSTPEREYADRPRDPDAKPVVPQRREAIKDGEDLPLYGKIEL